MAEKYASVVQDMYEDSGEVCSTSDRSVQDGDQGSASCLQW